VGALAFRISWKINSTQLTDGQCALETDLFFKGIRPAINVGLSGASEGRGYGFISQRASLWVRNKCPKFGSSLRRDHRQYVLTARAYPAHWSMQGTRVDAFPKSCDAPKIRQF
jgi:hypothetical protein